MGELVKKVKTREVNGKSYKYLEYRFDRKVFNTDSYFELKVNDKYKDSLKTIGGMAYKMLVKPIEEFYVKKVKIMFYLMEGMELVCLVKYEDDIGNELDYKLTKSGMFYKYIQLFLEDRQEYILKEDTTFNYLNEEHINNLKNKIYEPKTEEDVGYTYKGNVIEFNEEYELDSLNIIPKEHLNEDMFKLYDIIYKTYNIKKTVLKMGKQEGIYGVIGDIVFIKEDGKSLSWMDKIYIDYLLERKRAITYEEVLQREIWDEEERTAYDINELLDGKIKRGKLEDNTKQDIADELYETRKEGMEFRIQSDIYDLEDEEYTEMISRGYLEYLISKEMIK